MIRLQQFYSSLDQLQREQYAQAIGVSDHYIRYHLITRRRSPSPSLVRRIVKSSGGKLMFTDVLCDVYPELAEEIGGGSKTVNRSSPPATCGADQSTTTGVTTGGCGDHVAPTKVPRS